MAQFYHIRYYNTIQKPGNLFEDRTIYSEITTPRPHRAASKTYAASSRNAGIIIRRVLVKIQTLGITSHRKDVPQATRKRPEIRSSLSRYYTPLKKSAMPEKRKIMTLGPILRTEGFTVHLVKYLHIGSQIPQNIRGLVICQHLAILERDKTCLPDFAGYTS
eukprot:NODE_35_length_31537_cov_0.293403.p16 type:complete len:162 gc:universal NODE_35_length_31537_cov_0.293403:8204-7719(-)